MDVDQEHGCRVLIISPSLEGAIIFIEQLQGLSATVSANENPISQSRTSGPITVPYTISNRYYSADIHFAAYELQAVHAGMFSLDRSPDYKPPPAVVFVWIDGEPYVKQVEELSKTMTLSAYEAEVSLAVRISKLDAQTASPLISNTNVDLEDENMDIDTTLISFGFEYVDATREVSSHLRSESDSSDDVPSLPRVLDALSTIMWPSMRPSSTSGKRNLTSPLASNSSSNNANRQWERDSIMEELLSVSGIAGISGRDLRAVGSRDEGENDDTDDELDGAPFSPYDFNGMKAVGSNPIFDRTPGVGITSSGTRTWSAFSSPAIGVSTDTITQGEISLSPTDINATTPFGTRGPSFADGGPNHISGSNLSVEATKKVSIGFEDDFTVFVSAPPLASVPGRPSAWLPLDLSEAGFAAENTADADLDIETPLDTAIGTEDPLGLTPGLLDKSHLAPSSAQRGLSYRSLGSVSDFGGSDVDVEEKGMRQGYTALDEDGDKQGDEDEDGWEDGDDEDEWEDVSEEDQDDEKDMPTMDEVMAMAARIFGKMPLPGDTNADYPVGFKSAASAFSSQSVFAAASSTLKASQNAPSISESSTKPKDTPPSSSLSASTPSPKPKPKEAGSQSAANQSTRPNPGPDPAMIERMMQLGSATAMSDIQLGMAAMRERSAGNFDSSTKAPGRPPPSQPASSKGEEIDIDIDSEGEDADIPPFDLTRVLHSLQAVRGEIAGIDDEEERRKMAAKVALGLVYGMDMDADKTLGSGSSRKAGTRGGIF